jgi:Core-2/I-Branching enzyme
MSIRCAFMTGGSIVVGILSHRDPPLIRRLVDRVLEGERTVALVHHDPRSGSPGLTPSDRIRLVHDPQPCDWGRMNLAEAMFRVMGDAVRQVSDLEWLLLISGQDYPAQSLRTTESHLAGVEADAMLRFFPVPDDPTDDVIPWQARCRQRYLHRLRIPGDRRSVPFPRRPPFDQGLRLHIGDMWANLSRSAVEHLLEQYEEQTRVRRYLSRCSVPDEALLPTLLLHDSERLRILPERRRFIQWVEGQPHPEVLTEKDADAIRASGDYFARKVDLERSAALLDQLDRHA